VKAKKHRWAQEILAEQPPDTRGQNQSRPFSRYRESIRGAVRVKPLRPLRGRLCSALTQTAGTSALYLRLSGNGSTRRSCTHPGGISVSNDVQPTKLPIACSERDPLEAKICWLRSWVPPRNESVKIDRSLARCLRLSLSQRL
jgi:hypothetical protein